jgi:hypothetical protein
MRISSFPPKNNAKMLGNSDVTLSDALVTDEGQVEANSDFRFDGEVRVTRSPQQTTVNCDGAV